MGDAARTSKDNAPLAWFERGAVFLRKGRIWRNSCVVCLGSFKIA
jgi:hypothetical protein